MPAHWAVVWHLHPGMTAVILRINVMFGDVCVLCETEDLAAFAGAV
jgi:hypothetical protein